MVRAQASGGIRTTAGVGIGGIRTTAGVGIPSAALSPVRHAHSGPGEPADISLVIVIKPPILLVLPVLVQYCYRRTRLSPDSKNATVCHKTEVPGPRCIQSRYPGPRQQCEFLPPGVTSSCTRYLLAVIVLVVPGHTAMWLEGVEARYY
eukprot:1543962-Rhodomonas_salina.1